MSDILDLIDGAIEDWETSGDAMRWAPDVDVNQSQFTGLLAFDVDEAARRAARRLTNQSSTVTWQWTNARDCDRGGYSTLDEVTAWPEVTEWQLELVSRLFDVPAEMIAGWWRVVS
jgi:hypothetical protein